MENLVDIVRTRIQEEQEEARPILKYVKIVIIHIHMVTAAVHRLHLYLMFMLFSNCHLVFFWCKVKEVLVLIFTIHTIHFFEKTIVLQQFSIDRFHSLSPHTVSNEYFQHIFQFF